MYKESGNKKNTSGPGFEPGSGARQALMIGRYTIRTFAGIRFNGFVAFKPFVDMIKKHSTLNTVLYPGTGPAPRIKKLSSWEPVSF